MTLTTLKPLQFIFLGDKELFEGPESLVFSAVIIPDKASLMNSFRSNALYELGSTTGSELVFSAVTTTSDKASLMNSVRPCALYTLGSTTGSELVFSAVTELTWIDGVWTRKNP